MNAGLGAAGAPAPEPLALLAEMFALACHGAECQAVWACDGKVRGYGQNHAGRWTRMCRHHMLDHYRTSAYLVVVQDVCGWPDCGEPSGLTKWCPKHTPAPFCRYCLQPTDGARFCSEACERGDLGAFAVAVPEAPPLPSADQEALF